MPIPSPNIRTAAVAKQLSRALLSACVQSRAWTPAHDQTLHRFLPSSSPGGPPAMTPSLLSSIIDPFLLSHHHLSHGLFHWASQQPSFYHTPQTYHSLLKSLSTARQSNSVQALLRQARRQRIPLHASSYHLAIVTFLLCDRTLEAYELFWEVPVSNSDGSIVKVCNSLLAATADNGFLERAKKLFDEMYVRNVMFNDLGFGVFVGGFCRAVELDVTLSLIEEIKQRWSNGINGSIVALLVVDGLCHAGRIEEAWRALEGLRIKDCKPDFIAYRLVAEAFKAAGKLEETSRVLKQKRRLGVAPRMSDYREYTFVLISEGRLRMAKELGMAIVDGDFPIDDDVLNALVASVSSIDPESAVSFCMFMIKKERPPTFTTLISLSKNLCRKNKNNEMWDIFKILLSKDYFRDLEGYNVVISFLCKAGMEREAYDVIKEMRKKAINPDVSSYNLLMEACCKKDLLRPAKRLWDEMFAYGCCGNLHTYNILIQKFSEDNHADEAQRLFHHMLEKRVVPDGSTYTPLVKVLCQNNKIDEACQVFHKSVEQDTLLASYILRTLTICLCQEENFVAASNLLHGLAPKVDISHSHIILLRSLSESGKIDMAVEHVKWVRDNSPSQLQVIVNNLMASLSTAPKLEPVFQLLKALSKHGLVSGCAPWMDLNDRLLKV